MKNKRQHRIIRIIMVSILFLTGASTACAEPAKVLILPFNIYSGKDLSFLKDGVRDMLSTRLFVQDEVEPLSLEETTAILKTLPEKITEKEAIIAGQRAGVNYVIFGSLTAVGEYISTDARCVSMLTGKPAVMFHETGSSDGDVISHVNKFAEKINTGIFGKTARAAQIGKQPAQQPEVSNARKHPDTLWRERKGNNTKIAPVTVPAPVAVSPSVAVSPPVVVPAPDPVPVTSTQPAAIKPSSDEYVVPTVGLGKGEIWKSRIFKSQLAGVAVGDINGDKTDEIVTIGDRNISVYQLISEKLVKMGEISTGRSNSLIAVDVADINNNDMEEIFVTVFRQDTGVLKSFVLEWHGSGFERIAEKPRWFYRVIQVPKKGKILMGQRLGANNIFASGVYELKWKDGQYVEAERQPLSGWVNVFAFTYGDLFGEGKDIVAAYTNKDRLRLMHMDSGEEIFRSSEAYGGSAGYLESEDKDAASIGNYKERKRIYLPQRIFVKDTDNDGEYELIINENKEAAN
ncbi:FG-GAP-like repeat-containing protein, partial [Desulfobacterales bacterium HSG16]|nr:FG-GAP-like repeat-containing protein [Desulfobacterales bacterium HSG16]